MKVSFLLISVFSVMAVGTGGAGRVLAQQDPGTGARFPFAKTIWKMEQTKMPPEANGPRAVRQGAVPSSADFLGVGSLARPQAEQSGKPVSGSPVSQKIFVPAAQTPDSKFRPEFGKPLQTGSPVNVQNKSSARPPLAQEHGLPAARNNAGARPTAVRQTGRLSVKGVVKSQTQNQPQAAARVPDSYGAGYEKSVLAPGRTDLKIEKEVQGRVVQPQKH
jgi:hypothetical protein